MRLNLKFVTINIASQLTEPSTHSNLLFGQFGTMDRGSVYALSVFGSNNDQGEDTNIQIQTQLETFILDFRLDNSFIYR